MKKAFFSFLAIALLATVAADANKGGSKKQASRKECSGSCNCGNTCGCSSGCSQHAK